METVGKNRFTLKQIFRENWSRFLAVFPSVVSFYVLYNVWKVTNCREPDGLGYHTFACPDHPDQVCHVPRTCKSRFCTTCSKVKNDQWVHNMQQQFPNYPYFHVTFTVPSELRVILFEKRFLLNAVFTAVSDTLLSFCKERGFLPAIVLVMHTFGSDLKWHVHIHCIISAGGLKLTGNQERYTRHKERKKKNKRAKLKTFPVQTENPKWIDLPTFPFKVLQIRDQALLIKHLEKAILKNLASDNPDPGLKHFADPKTRDTLFKHLKRKHKKGFYVQLSEKRAALKATLSYVGRYALRPPLSEVRIKNYTGDMVTFEYKDYRNFGSKVRHTLKTLEFIKRLIRHIPPLYFNMIRHYGLLGSRRKSEFKATADKLLGRLKGFFQHQNWRERQTQHTGTDPLKCKICQKTMEFIAAHIPISLSKVQQQLQEGFAKP